MCYDCNSAYDPNCGDPFEPYTLGKVNCTQQEPLEHLKDKYTKPVLCRKTTQKGEYCCVVKGDVITYYWKPNQLSHYSLLYQSMAKRAWYAAVATYPMNVPTTAFAWNAPAHMTCRPSTVRAHPNSAIMPPPHCIRTTIIPSYRHCPTH